MLLLVIGILLLPPAIALTSSDIAIINSPETIVRDDSMPRRTNRGIVLTRKGGESPIKNLAVKVYEREGDFQLTHVNYAVLYHSGDYIIAHRQVTTDEFDKLWHILKGQQIMYLGDTPPSEDDDALIYVVKIRELKINNKFEVTNPQDIEDERYELIVNAMEAFWQDQVDIE